MSPRRIEERHRTPDGINVTTIRERADGFPVSQTDAAKILGMPDGNLPRLGGSEVRRIQPQKRSAAQTAENVIDDRTLLRMALRVGIVLIEEDAETGLTKLSTNSTTAVLNIPWAASLNFLNSSIIKDRS